MNTSVQPRLVFAAIAFLGVLSGCSKAPSEAPTSAIVLTFSRSSPTSPTFHHLTDKAQITRLESFFPNYRTRPASNTASGWIAGHEVYFNFAHGQTIRITVSENDNAAYWTVGDGDFQTHGDFSAFVDSLPR